MSTPRVIRNLFVALLCTTTSFIIFSRYNHHTPHNLETFKKCSISNLLATNLPCLNSASAISLPEFVERRKNLAQALVKEGVDAFIVEPGYTFQYYGNVSQRDWEPWEPEERPFLMVVRPVKGGNGDVSANITFLAPIFEMERVKLLGMPISEVEEVSFVAWEEHWNPYSTLRSSWGSPLEVDPKVMVDEEMRDFIQRGLSQNGFEVRGLGGEVDKVKQRKSKNEIEILRAVNMGTVEAIRAMRICLYKGLKEDEVRAVLDDTIRAGGMEPFFDIVLFDENASNPHGGTNGTKNLEAETLILIDVGAHLHGYSSDISRTFFPLFPSSSPPHSPSILRKIEIFNLVLTAQSTSLSALHPNVTASSIDLSARKVISEARYGTYFTHRVGHGIGIKAHESPYLHQGNTDSILQEGMVFTSEPGVYLPEFGVRIEDVALVMGE